jgi:phosphatidylinositol-bisphosphatase
LKRPRTLQSCCFLRRSLNWRKSRESHPNIAAASNMVLSHLCRYEKEIVKSVSIKNTSRVPAIWRLVPEENATAPVPDWMTVDPPCVGVSLFHDSDSTHIRLQGLLLPDETAQITIKILVTKKLATDLNLGSRRLEHTLILRAILGTDYFIAIGGDYGSSLKCQPHPSAWAAVLADCALTSL